MDNTNVSDRCIVKIIRDNKQIEEKVMENEKQFAKLLEGVLQKLILLNKGEMKNDY